MKRFSIFLVFAIVCLASMQAMAFNWNQSNAKLLAAMKKWDAATWATNMQELITTQDTATVQKVLVIAEKAINSDKKTATAKADAVKSVTGFVVTYGASGYSIGLAPTDSSAATTVDVSGSSTTPIPTSSTTTPTPTTEVPTSSTDVPTSSTDVPTGSVDVDTGSASRDANNE